jgi:hypothetical protein
MIDGAPGGRSTYGICFGALHWRIAEGHKDDLALEGLEVALLCRYSDDEPGSPWTIRLYVDERGTDEQREALADIFLGHEGGPHVVQLPWVRKPSELLDVRPARIVSDATSFAVSDVAELRLGGPADVGKTVSCLIPGHERGGHEHVAERLRVEDPPYEWTLTGNCAFATDFDYASE